MKKRILHCIPTMEGGGAERQLTYLCKGMHKLGWHMHVALFREGPNIQRLRNSGAIIHKFESFGNHDPLNFLRIARVIRRIRPDLVQTWLPMMDIVGGLASRACGLPHILSERNSRSAYPRTWKNDLRERLGLSAEAIISNSREGDAYWAGNAPPHPPRRFVIPNAIPIDEIEQVQPMPLADLGVGPNERCVVYVGRLEAQKNVPALIEAFHSLVSERNVHAVVIGDGPERSRIESMVRDSTSAHRINVRPYHHNVWSILKSAHVFVSVSHFEGMPNTVMEAMACGCPVVLSDISQHRALADDSCAAFVNPDRPQDIANRIAHLLDNPDEGQAKAAAAKRAALEWSVSRLAEAYAAAYMEVFRSNMRG